MVPSLGFQMVCNAIKKACSSYKVLDLPDIPIFQVGCFFRKKMPESKKNLKVRL
jgi:hypothetical protein